MSLNKEKSEVGEQIGFYEAVKQLLRDHKEKTLYTTAESARAYDYVARKFFERDKLATCIANAFNNYLPQDLRIEDCVICDRAAGTGIISKALQQFGYKVRASDINEAQLDRIRKEKPDIMTVVEDFNGEMTGVENSSVHGIVQVGATRYMTPDGEQNYVKEARRVLVQNGILIWPVFISEIPEAKFVHGHDHKSSYLEITELLEQNGFEILAADTIPHGIMATLTCRLVIARKSSVAEYKNDLRNKVELLRKTLKVKLLSNLDSK